MSIFDVLEAEGARILSALAELQDSPAGQPAERRRCLMEAGDRIRRRNRIVEGRNRADVGPEPSVTHTLDDLAQLGTIRFDDEVDRHYTAGGLLLGRPDDGHEPSSGSNQPRRSLADVAADQIEHQVDLPDVFQCLAVEVDELVRAEVERRPTVGVTSCADDVGTELTCKLRHHRPDCTGRAVHEEAPPRLQPTVLEQSLPRG